MLNPMADVVLVHGAASTAHVWDAVIAELDGIDVLAPDRPGTGSLDSEIDWLESLASGAVVFGMSGGATLALGLAMRGASARAIIAHEPAAGSLSPELFAPLAQALGADGVAGFGAALYGPLWSLHPSVSEESVRADLAMFRSFEPAPAIHPHVLITTGDRSPAIRHTIAARLSELGYSTATLPGSSHFAAAEAPCAVATLIRAAL